jgi:hypothetical protein
LKARLAGFAEASAKRPSSNCQPAETLATSVRGAK